MARGFSLWASLRRCTGREQYVHDAASRRNTPPPQSRRPHRGARNIKLACDRSTQAATSRSGRRTIVGKHMTTFIHAAQNGTGAYEGLGVTALHRFSPRAGRWGRASHRTARMQMRPCTVSTGLCLHKPAPTAASPRSISSSSVEAPSRGGSRTNMYLLAPHPHDHPKTGAHLPKLGPIWTKSGRIGPRQRRT